ncbi:MAG: hypothetical protein BGO79_17290 [Delftia sp. 67-8]|nr:MAG: hypothetical protein BGO79_17290 [Delftia sp. 67-8]
MHAMTRKSLRPIGTIHATRESDGAAVTVQVFREVTHGTYSEGGGYEAEGGRVFKLAGQTLRVDGSDQSYLSSSTDRYKLPAPL